MIILVADDNALSRELIRELLEGSGQVAEKSGFRQISWYRTTLIDLHDSLTYPLSTLQLLEINHNVAQTPILWLIQTLKTKLSMALPTDCGRVAGNPEVMPRASTSAESIYEIGSSRKVSRKT